MKYQLAIFDLDGTLLNTLDDLADSVNYILNQFGYPVRTLTEVRCFVGNGIRKLIERSAPAGTAEEEIDVRCHTNIDNLVNKLIGIAQEYYWEILTEKNLYCVFVATSVIIAREEWIPEINTFNGCYNLWCRIENVPYDLLRERLKKFGI